MTFDEAAAVLAGIPYTSVEKGRIFYDLVTRRRPKRILEMGFAHGVSACYLAAAAHAVGGCTVTAVDIEASLDFDPSIETLSKRLGVDDLIDIHREVSSYTWFLKKGIEKATVDGRCQPVYDIIFIDGPKDWTNDGLAFFLSDKLLKEGGLIIFDDYDWSYRRDEAARGKTHERGYIFPRMSEEEFVVPHIKAVFELLVMQHGGYGNFEVIDDVLALATKTSAPEARTLTYSSRASPKYRLTKLLRKFRGA